MTTINHNPSSPFGRRRGPDPISGSPNLNRDPDPPPPVYASRDDVRLPLPNPSPQRQERLTERQMIRRHLTSAFNDDHGEGDTHTTVPLGRGRTGNMEAGIDPNANTERDNQSERSRGSVMGNIMQMYRDYREGPSTIPRRRSMPRASSMDTTYTIEESFNPELPKLSRAVSMSSVATETEVYDDDDPRITGLGRNNIDEQAYKEADALAKEKRELYGLNDKKEDGLTPAERSEKEGTERQLRSLMAKQKFVLRLAKALMLYGAPSHRLESQIMATGRVLSTSLQVIIWPGVSLISFDDKASQTSETHIVKVTTRLMLGKLHTVHQIYRSVVHSQIGVEEGTRRLSELLKAPTIYSRPIRCGIAFCCAFVICLQSFGGSIIDALVAGCAGLLLAFLQLMAAPRSVLYANVFEISTALWIAFFARGLSSWQGDYFCYSAIQSAGVVLILPGFAVLTSALDLVSKNFVSGSARIVWAITYTLFLGFSITVGSDFWFVVDPSARNKRKLAAESLTTILNYNGSFTPDANSTALFNSLQQSLNVTFDGTWQFVNQTSNVSQAYHYQIVGCYRDPTWQWWRRPFPTWTLFLLVPLYSFCSASWNLQPWRSKQMPVVMSISSISYLARKILQIKFGVRQEVVSAIGAFIIGVFGNVYARVFKGTAFSVMVTGVNVLVPSSLAATGGLAMNYQGKDTNQYQQTIQIGVRMLEVAVGTTVGLLASSLVVYTFGTRKRSALFAF